MTEPAPIRTEQLIARPEGRPFDPPEGTGDQPLRRLEFSDGHIGWLVTGHAQSRAVLADPRFSSRYDLARFPFPGMPAGTMPPGPVGDLTAMDDPEHARFRKLLAGRFTVRRMRLLTERVEQIATEHLDAMERQGPPLDLVTAYAQPLPAMMICELLGVPYDAREEFGRITAALGGQDDAMDQFAAFAAMGEYIGGLVRAKRAEPTDDLLSDVVRAGDLTDEELAGVGAFLLGAGLDTTANMIGLGTYALLQNPDQLRALRSDPALADQAVEELLRYLTVAPGVTRAALEDVELDGHLIEKGSTVVVALNLANRDPERFANPDTLDIRRRATGHVAFGHGIHQCLGQQLARVEMRIAFPALLQRFPTLRLAVSPEEIEMRGPVEIYGVRSLPVTWDPARDRT